METIGLLSGIGHLPVDVALSAKSMGYRVIAVGVVPDIDPELAEAVDAYYDIHIGKIGKIINIFLGILFPISMKKLLIFFSKYIATIKINQIFISFNCVTRIMPIKILHKIVFQI